MGKTKSLKKGDTKALAISHPNSRKAKSLAKKIIKASTREKVKKESAVIRNLLYGKKLVWFQENLEPGNEYTAPMLERLFEKYLKRFDEELEQIAIKHSIGQRKNRQHANREDIIKHTMKSDYDEYNGCGIEMVDILNPKQLKQFREWDGNLGVHFKLRRFSKSFIAKYKPPNQPESRTENPAQEDMAVERIESTGAEPEICEDIENAADRVSEPSVNEEQSKTCMDVEMNGT